MEENERCRFWPRCDVHRGVPRDRTRGAGRGQFSAANRAEMVELRAAGWQLVDIAAAFGTWASVVGYIVRDELARGEVA